MSSIESHLSNKPKQVFFLTPINIFDTFTHSITPLYIFNIGPPISESIDLSSYPLDNMRMDLLSTVEIDDGLKEAKKMNLIEGDVKVLVETSSIIRKLRRGLIAIEEAGSNYVDKSHYNPNKDAATTVVSKYKAKTACIA